MTKRQFLLRGGQFAAMTALGGPLTPLLSSLDAQTANSARAKDNRITKVTVTSVNVPCEYVAGSYKR